MHTHMGLVPASTGIFDASDSVPVAWLRRNVWSAFEPGDATHFIASSGSRSAPVPTTTTDVPDLAMIAFQPPLVVLCSSVAQAL